MDIKTVEQIMRDFGTHQWVKDQYTWAKNRDIVDAINDAEILTEMLKARFNQMAKGDK